MLGLPNPIGRPKDLLGLVEKVLEPAARGVIIVEYQQNAARAKILLQALADPAFQRTLDADFEEIASLIKRTSFERFRSSWKMGRQLVSLQARLVIEQVLWNQGNPWRSLVTGFKPIQ
jgi:hypothetical protein